MRSLKSGPVADIEKAFGKPPQDNPSVVTPGPLDHTARVCCHVCRFRFGIVASTMPERVD